MKVLKFGGTSVADSKSINNVISILKDNDEPLLIIVSALGGITNLLQKCIISKGKSVDQTEQDLKKLFPQDTWSRRHLQIIFFGREHCPALRHNLSDCLICSWAASKKQIILESRK